MARRLADIGFPIENDRGYQSLRLQVAEEGEIIYTPFGSYFFWSPSKGVELWGKAMPEAIIGHLHPHFMGKARMHVAIVERKAYEENHPLAEGFFVAYPNPVKGQGFLSKHFCLQYGDGTYSSYIPFLFDAPDYDRYVELELPFIAEIQITAFPLYLQAFETEDDFIDWQLEGDKSEEEDPGFWSGETFCPYTATHKRKSKDDYPAPMAMIAGTILDTAILDNEATGAAFCWAKVITTAGEIDVVASPDIINGYVVQDGVLNCDAFLSGRIVHIADTDSLME
jgi:hypothetical protein